MTSTSITSIVLANTSGEVPNIERPSSAKVIIAIIGLSLNSLIPITAAFSSFISIKVSKENRSVPASNAPFACSLKISFISSKSASPTGSIN